MAALPGWRCGTTWAHRRGRKAPYDQQWE